MLSEDSSKPQALSQRDRSMVVIIGLILFFQGWNLAGFRVPMEFANLLLTATAFIIPFIPLKDPSSSKPIDNLKRLLSFPIFWLGLLLLLFITMQACNPAFIYAERPDKSWAILSQKHISWLPSGIDSPFEQTNPWRELLMKSPFWLIACALWTGVRRGKAGRILLWILSINVSLVVAIGIIYKVSSPNSHIYLGSGEELLYKHAFGSFVNRNHASMFIYISMIAPIYLLLSNLQQLKHDSGHYNKSTPLPILVLLILAPAVGVFMTSSRAGSILGLGILVGSMILLLFQARTRRQWAIIFTLVILGGIAGRYVYSSEQFLYMYERIENIEQNRDVEFRLAAADGAYSMFVSKPMYGYGAGSFRYLYVDYQIAKYGGVWPLWRYAHNDYAQHLAAFGVVGASIWFCILFFWVYLGARATWRSPSRGSVILLVLAAAALHSCVDYLMYTPSVIIVLSAVVYLINICISSDIKKHRH